MSKKLKPIQLKENTYIHYKNHTLTINNTQFTNTLNLKNDTLLLLTTPKTLVIRQITLTALLGTYNALIKNAIIGIYKPFKAKLLIEGIGYSAKILNTYLQLELGFNKPKLIELPHNIICKTKNKLILLSSSNKEHLGNLSAKLTHIRKYNAYKKKGIRHINKLPVLKKRAKK